MDEKKSNLIGGCKSIKFKNTKYMHFLKIHTTLLFPLTALHIAKFVTSWQAQNNFVFTKLTFKNSSYFRPSTLKHGHKQDVSIVNLLCVNKCQNLQACHN